MATTKDGDTKHYEYTDAARPVKRKGGLKRHCARFWWIYVIAFIIAVLAVVLPLIFVAYPRIAQNGINNARLVPSAQILRNPAPGAADLTLDSFLLTDSSLHPDLDSFDASFYLEGRQEPFITATIPAIKAENGTVARIQQRIQITNLAEFTRYTGTLLSAQNFVVYLKGRGGLKQGALPKTNVNYDQRITLSGLNSLQGLEITYFRLGEDLPYGSNAFGNVTIPNPSVTSASFGDVTLDLFVDGNPIGNTTVPDLNLAPGNNSYPLYATVNTTAIAGVLQSPRYRCGVINLEIRGNQSVFDGAVIPYFTQPLQSSTQRTMFNLTDTLNAAGFGFLVNGTCEA
ncbi:hypothetical protein CAC42_4338 [Sphaceloma murrayae]|uniref:Uncharacterized protein n=1 Tax=Sphaceloma murrayae TaxID=2082308 RepID=A0A2K1QLB5_9PEZI|nr:hypothetical protein CAC42_4338 [Sphaceloma murrayae]